MTILFVMKTHQVFVLGILIFAVLLTQPVSGEVVPQLEEVSFNLPNNATVGPNEVVRLQANVSHGSSPSEVSVNGQLGLSYWNGNFTETRYLDYLWMEYNATSGLYEASFTIGPFWPEGVLYVMYIDISTPSNYYYYNNGTNYISPILMVSGTDPDLTPPELISFTSSHSSGAVLGPGETISFTINVIDNQSGFSNAYLDIYYDNGNYSEWITNLYFDPNTPGVSSFTGTQSFTVGQYFDAGTYFVDNLWMMDMEGNGRSYTSSELNFSFVVNGTTIDVTPPTLRGLDILSQEARPGNDIEVWVDVFDDVSGMESGWVDVYAWSSTTGNMTYAGYGSFSDNGTLEANLTVLVYIDTFYDLSGFDYIFVYSVGLNDMAGNYMNYYNGSDFASPMVPLVPNTPPVLNAIWVDSTIHRAGENAIFGLEISDDSPSSLGTYTSNVWVDAQIVEERPDGFRQDTYSTAYTNGSAGQYFLDYFIDYSAPSNTTVFISSLKIEDGANSVYLVHGVNMTSPIVTVFNEGPSDEKIEVSITPNAVTTEVGFPVDFEILVNSTFQHDMPNVTLVLEVIKDGQSKEVYRASYYLMAHSYFREIVTVSFDEAGSYKLVGTLYDDIGAPWSYSVRVDVSDPSTDGVPSNTDNSTTSATNSSVEGPTLEISGLEGLPGFDLPMAMFGLVAIGYVIRKRKNLT